MGYVLHSTGYKLFVIMLLTYATVFLSNNFKRYQTIGNDLIRVDNYVGNEVNKWKKRGDVSLLLDKSNITVRLHSDTDKRVISFSKRFDNLGRGSKYRLAAQLKTENVSYGDKVWKAARIIFVAEDSEGRPIYSVPHILVARNGTTTWESYSRVFTAISHAASYQVNIQLVNVTGTLWVKDLSLIRIEETESYIIYKSVIAVLWLMVFIWLLLPYKDSILSSNNIILATMLLFAIIASLITVDIKHGMVAILNDLYPWFNFKNEATFFRVGHFIVYFLITLLALIRFSSNCSRVLKNLSLLVMFAATTEILQFLADGRTPRLFDFYINVCGIVSGLAVLYILVPAVRSSLKREVGKLVKAE